MLTLEQSTPPTPGQPVKQPLPIPLKLALFGAESGAKLAEQTAMLDAARQRDRVRGLAERPILSLNRDFSAPIIVETDRSADDLAFLSARDDNPFARYEAMQQLMLDTLLHAIATGEEKHGPVVEAVRRTLTDRARPGVRRRSRAGADRGLYRRPDGRGRSRGDPRARESLRARLGRELEPLWRAAYSATAADRFELSPAAKGARRLRTVALGYLMAAGEADAPALALKQFDGADNMTDRQGALTVLANSEAAERERALAAFYERYRGNALVIDKWFIAQALSSRDDTLQAVERLLRHPDFTLGQSEPAALADRRVRRQPARAPSAAGAATGSSPTRSSRSTSSTRRTRRSWCRRSAAGAASARKARREDARRA